MRWRVAIVVVWLAIQLALILTGPRRSSGAFAFRMFPETSDIEIHLWRRLPGGARQDLPTGVWSARGPAGEPEIFSWSELVAPFGPARLDHPVWASYGGRAQLDMLQAALDWVSRHTPEDAETILLGADVTVWTNGRPPYQLRLQSAPR